MRISFSGVFGEIDSLPGCSQVGVSHSVFVPPEKRGAGNGANAHKERLEYMREQLGYDFALCTVDHMGNPAQVAILRSNGWHYFTSFKSSKTGHMVAIYGKHLTS